MLPGDKPGTFLQQYGVLGMKWGKHRASSIKTIKPAKAGSSDDAAAKSALLQKPVHTMSNQELRTLNERLQLEKTYRQLTTESTSKGENYVKRLLGTAKTANEFYNLANSPAVKDLRKVVDANRK